MKLLITLGIIVYLFIGGAIAGFVTIDSDGDGYVASIALLWPLFILLLAIVTLISIPMQLARKIKERIC